MKKILCFAAIFVLIAIVTPTFAGSLQVKVTVVGGNLKATPEGPYSLGFSDDTLHVKNLSGVELFVTYRARFKQVIITQQILDGQVKSHKITGQDHLIDFDRTGAVMEPELRYRISGGRLPALSTIGLIALIALVAFSAVFLWRRKIRLARI